MKARVKAIFTFDIYVNGEYLNEASYIKGNAITFKQAIAEAKKRIRNFSANHVQIFLMAGSLAVADVTMFNREITVNDYSQDYTPAPTAPETSETMNTETEKGEKTIEVEIYHDGDTCNAIAGGENPAVVGWVDKWFNNTFAAGMQFGIKARKAIAIEELTGRDLAHHGFMTAENAKLWLVDQIRDYFRDHGYNLKVVNL